MKELSIEERAKAYDEVLKKARMFYKDEHVDNEVNSLLEVLFPELKESEYERIRKALIEFVQGIYMGCRTEEACKERDMFLAWLEKQGEKGTNGNEREFPNLEPPLTIKHAKEVMGIKQNDAWSEEDKKMLAQVINEIEAIKFNSSTLFERNIAQDKIDWLKSLKERVQTQPKQEWNGTEIAPPIDSDVCG